MSEISEFERSANQYITQKVADGIRREEVLADWIRSDNADLQKYAKSLLAAELNPQAAAAEAKGNAAPEGSSYVDMAKDMLPIVAPVALTSAAAYYYGKKKGKGIAPPGLSDFEAKRQQLELEKIQAQIETERARAARFAQMSSQGQSLETQAKFSEPTAIEAAADTTSVKVPSPATVEAEISKVNPLNQTNLTPEDIQARAAQLKALEPVSTPISAAPVDAPAPTPSPAPGSFATEAIVNEVKEMIQETPAPVAPPQELRTGTGKPAFAGMAPPPKFREKGKMAGKPIFKNEYARPEDVPAGYAFVPGAQVIDPARQDMGQSVFTKTYMAQDYPLTDKMAREQASEVNRMLGRPTRAELKAAGLEAAPNTPGITQYINQPKGSGMGTKAVKVGGVLGALVAIPDLAKAETSGQRGMAGANLLEAVLPPGFTMSGAGEGSGTVPAADQAMLLGSPYAQTPLAVKRRQALEYAAKVGGGRGLTPASAYLR